MTEIQPIRELKLLVQVLGKKIFTRRMVKRENRTENCMTNVTASGHQNLMEERLRAVGSKFLRD